MEQLAWLVAESSAFCGMFLSILYDNKLYEKMLYLVVIDTIFQKTVGLKGNRRRT